MNDFRRVMPFAFPLRGRPRRIIPKLGNDATHQGLHLNLREKPAEPEKECNLHQAPREFDSVVE